MRFQPGSLIFVEKSKLDAFRLENNVHRFQSTSPSWPLLAQMDKARAQLCEQGAADYQRLHALLADFQASISTLPVRCIQADPQQRTFPAWCWMFPAWEHPALRSANSLMKWGFG